MQSHAMAEKEGPSKQTTESQTKKVKVKVTGLTAKKDAIIGGSGVHIDLREGEAAKADPGKFPENLHKDDGKDVEMEFEFKDTEIEGTPVIGQSESYIDKRRVQRDNPADENMEDDDLC